MRFLQKFFAGILFTLVTGLFLPFLVMFLVLQTYLSQSFLKQTFLIDSYMKSDLVFQQVDLPQGQDREVWMRNFKKIFPKDRYVLLAGAFFDDFVSGLSDFTPGSPLKVSLESTKKEALSEVKKFGAQMAPCASGENSEKDFCIPPIYSPSQQKLFREEMVKQFSGELEARIPSSLTFQENAKFPFLQYVSVLLRFHTEIIWGMVGMLLVLIIFMDLILWRPVMRFFRWNASTFLLFSLESFSLYFLFAKIPELLLKVEPIKPSMIELINWLLSYFIKYTVVAGILFGALWLVSFGVSFFLPHEHTKKV